VSQEQSPLQYMGTQSQETMNMAEAMTPAAVLARQREFDEALAPLAGQADDAGAASVAGSKLGDAASWAMGKAKDTLRSAAGQARTRTAAAVASYTREDPLRAILIAAGAGALLMGVLSRMTRPATRAVDRRIRR
jgi:ElaB/YqjD/DUF883 family membrane-anchored ribosome-binding protein